MGYSITITISNEQGNYEFKSQDGKIKTQSKEDLLEKNNLFESLPEIELEVKELEENVNEML